MSGDKEVEQWMADMQARLNRTDHTLRKEQTLYALLVKITELMRSGDFKSAALYRKEFDMIRNSVEQER